LLHDALDRGVDGLEAVVEAEPGRAQRWAAIIGQGAAHGEAVGARRVRGRIGPGFELPFERTHFPDVLFELLLGMAIGFVDRLGRFAEVVELAELVGHARQRGPDRPANRVLAVGDDSSDRHRQRLPDLVEQGGEIVLRRAQQAPSEEHLPGQAIAQYPDHLMAHIRLQAIQGEQHAALPEQAVAEAVLIGQPQGQQLFVALHEVRDRALGDIDPAGAEGLMDFGNRPMRGIAVRADPGDHVEPEFAVRERPAALFFGPIGPVIQGAGGGPAAADLACEVYEPLQSHHRARIGVGYPQAPATGCTVRPERFQHPRDRRIRAAFAFGHAAPSG
jgi:hypothetical protein